jgi:6-phosphogluconolactonase (cycloisomerase 2 family)
MTMDGKTIKYSMALPGAFSRRGFFRGASAIAASAPILSKAATGQVLAYVGAYTDRGRGIHIFDVGTDGSLNPVSVLTGLPSPSSIAFAPNKKFLYAVNEIGNFGGMASGSVTAMSVETDGSLKIINVVSSMGGGPAHLSVDPSGKWVFAANYGGGSVSVIPINADGSLGNATDTQALPRGPYGPQPARDAPPGSFAISGHDAPHAHQAQTDPSGNFLLVSDLATDRVYSFKLDKAAGKLTPSAEPFVQASPGAGPRHFDFHPNGRWVYSLNEEASTIDFMTYDAATGALAIQSSVSSLPPGYEGTNYPSEIHVSGDGRFVYAANRLCDTIGHFSIDADGFLTRVGHYWTRGSYPRHFAIEPFGRFLYVCHSRSDNVTSFGVDHGTGRLNFTGKFTGVGNPSKIDFLAL